MDKIPTTSSQVYIQLKIHTKYKRKPQIYLHLSTSHSYKNFPYFLCSHILALHPFSFSLRSLHCSSLSHAASINFSLLSNPLLSLFFKGNDTPFPFDTLSIETKQLFQITIHWSKCMSIRFRFQLEKPITYLHKHEEFSICFPKGKIPQWQKNEHVKRGRGIHSHKCKIPWIIYGT